MYFIIMISYGLVLLLTPAAVFLSLWIRSLLALPLLTSIAAFFPFLMEAQESLLRGFLLLLCWTVVLSACILWLSWKHPERVAPLIWRSRQYTESMFRWIQTGQLPEGGPAQVLLFHLKQTIIYCVLAMISANFLGLVLGSTLLNYMNFYVASLARDSLSARSAFWMGWNPWSIIRVLTFLYLGIIMSTPTLWLLIGTPWRLNYRLFAPAAIGLLLDLILKLFISKSWSRNLRDLTAT